MVRAYACRIPLASWRAPPIAGEIRSSRHSCAHGCGDPQADHQRNALRRDPAGVRVLRRSIGGTCTRAHARTQSRASAVRKCTRLPGQEEARLIAIIRTRCSDYPYPLIPIARMLIPITRTLISELMRTGRAPPRLRTWSRPSWQAAPAACSASAPTNAHNSGNATCKLPTGFPSGSKTDLEFRIPSSFQIANRFD